MRREMNKYQLNLITHLQSKLGDIKDKCIEDLTSVFELAMDKNVEVSDDPKKDGEENFRKLEDLKEELKLELREVFEKFDKKLNLL